MHEHFVYMNAPQPNVSNASSSGGGEGNPNPEPNSNNNFNPASVNPNGKYERSKFSYILNDVSTDTNTVPVTTAQSDSIVAQPMTTRVSIAPAPSAPVLPNPEQSNTYYGKPLSGRIIHKTDGACKDYLIAEPDSDTDRIRLDQLKRGALSKCEVKQASITRKGAKSILALDLSNVPHLRVIRDNYQGVIIPNIFDQND